MNRKQEMIKKMAKRAKARSNKVVPSNPSNKPVERYISKAERAKMALEETQNATSTDSAAETETISESSNEDKKA